MKPSLFGLKTKIVKHVWKLSAEKESTNPHAVSNWVKQVVKSSVVLERAKENGQTILSWIGQG
jgi:hypothetical protein